MVGGLLGGLFGGSESKVTNPPPPQTKAVSTKTPEQEELLKNLIDQLGSLGGFEATSIRPEGGFIAPLGTGERSSLDALEQASLFAAPGGGAFDALLRTITEPFDTEGFNQFFTETVERPLTTNFFENIVPDIAAKFAPSFFSSDRGIAQENAFEDLLDSITEQRAGLAFETEQAGRDRSLAATGLLPLLQSLLTTNLGAQALPRELEQAGISADTSEKTRQIAETQQFINTLLAAAGLDTTENIGSAPVVLPGQEGVGGDLIGAIGPIIGGLAAAGAFSHSSFKVATEIVDEEFMLKGVERLPIQRWTYKGFVNGGMDDKEHLGPYAEDFKEIFDVGDGVTIQYLDAIGVLLSAVKGLAARLRLLEDSTVGGR